MSGCTPNMPLPELILFYFSWIVWNNHKSMVRTGLPFVVHYWGGGTVNGIGPASSLTAMSADWTNPAQTGKAEENFMFLVKSCRGRVTLALRAYCA